VPGSFTAAVLSFLKSISSWPFSQAYFDGVELGVSSSISSVQKKLAIDNLLVSGDSPGHDSSLSFQWAPGRLGRSSMKVLNQPSTFDTTILLSQTNPLNPIYRDCSHFIERHALSPIDKILARIMKSKEKRYRFSTPSGLVHLTKLVIGMSKICYSFLFLLHTDT
jgi:hypothetical protein